MGYEPGGIASLVAILERWDALEADFASEYHIDLGRALWVDGMSLRRFRALLHGLPPSARTWHEENGGWSRTDHLLAAAVEVEHDVYRAVIASIPRGKHDHRRPPEPWRIPRPGQKPKQSMSMGQMARAMSGRG